MHTNAYWIIAWKKNFNKHLFCSVAVSNDSIFDFFKSLSDVWYCAKKYAYRATTITTTTNTTTKNSIVIGHSDLFLTFLNHPIEWKFQFYARQCVITTTTATQKKSICVRANFSSLYLFKKKIRYDAFFILLLLIPNFLHEIPN